MGGGEEMLSAQERAALAQLEARAAADDPRLADHLRGAARRGGGRHELAAAAVLATRLWRRLHPPVWGPVLLVAGLALAVLGLSTTLAVGVLGVALTTAGLALVVEALAGRARRWAVRPARQPLDS